MTTGDGLERTLTYTARLQPWQMTAGSQLALGLTWRTNGTLQNQTVTRPGWSATQTYTYDGVGRLQTATEGSSWSQTYVYDKSGNRAITGSSSMLVSNNTPQSPDGLTVPFDGANHWQAAAGYDAAGNMTALRTQTMTYDAESRMTKWTDSGTGGNVALTYDGDGRRVLKTAGGTTTTYVYDPAGNVAAEYGGGGAATATLYLTQDYLGSTRLVTNAAGCVGAHDYLPFGEEIPATFGRSGVPCYGQTVTPVKFTGQERDAETGLDNFLARHMAPAQGRFLSPDPDNAGADPTNPQSWNMYSYAGNNPLVFVDPSGLCYQDADGGYHDDDGEPCSVDQNGALNPGGNTSVSVTDTAPPVNYDWSDTSDFTFFSDSFGFGSGGGGGGGGTGTTPLPGSPRTSGGGSCGPTGYRDATPQERAKVLGVARANVGGRYRNGAGGSSSPQSGFDCSGFVGYCIRQAGIPYNYSPTSSMASNPALGPATGGAQSGDVVLFPGHAGFNDPGQSTAGSLLNAQSTAAGVRYSPPSWFGKGQTLRIRVKCK